MEPINKKMEPINKNWTDEQNNHQGGVSTGIGFTISWQRGPLQESGRNGAFLIEVLQCCHHQLAYYQNSKFSCPENSKALDALESAIKALQARRDRRASEGTLGTHNV
jgi:hypothetical protein